MSDYEYRREAEAAYRCQMYEDLAGTYDKYPPSPRHQARLDAIEEGIEPESPTTTDEEEE